MIGATTPFQAAAATYAAVAPLPSRQPAGVVVEPVVRSRAISSRTQARREPAFLGGRESPAFERARAGAEQPAGAPFGDGRRRAALPSAAFLAQAIGQATAEPAAEDQPFHPGRDAYRLAAERNTTYSGFIGPVDVVI